MLRVVPTNVLVPQPVLDIVSGFTLFYHMFMCYQSSNKFTCHLVLCVVITTARMHSYLHDLCVDASFNASYETWYYYESYPLWRWVHNL